MGSWWQGTRLVAERGLVENLRSRSFKLLTGLLLLMSVAAVVVPQILGSEPTTYTLATAGTAPVNIRAALDAAGKSAKFTVKYVTRDNADAVQQAVRQGDATAGLAGDTLYTEAQGGGTFPVVVAQAVVSFETSRLLVEAGLTPKQVAALQSVRPPRQVAVGKVMSEGRAGTGFAAGDITLAVAWFLLGFMLYAFLFAASAALVNKITEVNSAILPVTMTLVVGYMLGITVVTQDPGGGLSVAASMFPLSAPMAMPIRWASGEVPVWQLLLAMALTAAAAVLMVSIASSIYRRALLITGHRVKLREVLDGRAAS